MIHGGEIAEIQAIATLQHCLQSPPESELLPLLALSVLVARPPFSVKEIAALAVEVSRALVAERNPKAADNLLGACVRSCERSGSQDAAADLIEAQAILRWKGNKACQ